MAGMMNSGASFLPRANEKFESNSQPSETDVVERSPDNRYIRVNYDSISLHYLNLVN